MKTPLPRALIFATLSAIVLIAGSDDGWFGFTPSVTVGGSFWSPLVESIVIKKVVPGSPVDKAQISVGDSIIKIDNSSVVGMKSADLKIKMKKHVGESVLLKLKKSSGNYYTVTVVTIKKLK